MINNSSIQGLIRNKISKSSALDCYAGIVGEWVSKGARSPALWNSAFNTHEINAQMFPLEVEPANLVKLLEHLEIDKSFIGGAIAAPYKEKVYEWLGCDNILIKSRSIGAINCLFRNSNGFLNGVNTDGEASIRAFKDTFPDSKLKKILILGCGGVGKAVIKYFSDAFGHTSEIIVSSRSEIDIAYCRQLNTFHYKFHEIDGVLPTIELLVNCTSVGSLSNLESSPLTESQMRKLKSSTIIYDVVYQPKETKLIRMGREMSLRTLNGELMNLYQAVLAYEYSNKSKYGIDATIGSMKNVVFD